MSDSDESKTGIRSTKTVMENVNEAESPSSSLTDHVYSVIDNTSVGVPDIRLKASFNINPAGRSGDNEYVRSPSPPLAVGSVNPVIGVPIRKTLSDTVESKTGIKSGRTVIENINESVSPSLSLTDHVYSVVEDASVGVPDICLVASFNDKPPGRSGVSE